MTAWPSTTPLALPFAGTWRVAFHHYRVRQRGRGRALTVGQGMPGERDEVEPLEPVEY